MTRPTRKGEHLAGTGSLVRSNESRYYNPGTQNLSLLCHCWLPVRPQQSSCGLGTALRGRRFQMEPGHVTQPAHKPCLLAHPDPVSRPGFLICPPIAPFGTRSRRNIGAHWFAR